MMSIEDEATLWNSGVILGTGTPESLFRAFVFVEVRSTGVSKWSNLCVFLMVIATALQHKIIISTLKMAPKNISNVSQKLEVPTNCSGICITIIRSLSSCILDLYISKLLPDPKIFYLQWLLKKPADPDKP